MQPGLPLHDIITPDSVLAVLGYGRARGQSAAELCHAITGHHRMTEQRQLRDVIVALRSAGFPVCGHPARGYFMAKSAEELNATCEFLYSRSMTSLKQVSAMKRVTLPDLRGQLGLPLRKEQNP